MLVAKVIDIKSLCDRALDYRDEDRLYPLQGSSWYTGFSSDGRQMLVVYDDAHVTVLWFEVAGLLTNTETVPHNLTGRPGAYFQRDEYPQLASFLRERFGYRDGTIHIRQFQDRASGVAVKPLPYWIETFILEPERTPENHRQEFAAEARDWLDTRDTYALEVWGNTFFIDINDGRCTGS